jgi:hypothetical protein
VSHSIWRSYFSSFQRRRIDREVNEKPRHLLLGFLLVHLLFRQLFLSWFVRRLRLGHTSSSPIGSAVSHISHRWCRSAQPPANRCDPSGIIFDLFQRFVTHVGTVSSAARFPVSLGFRIPCHAASVPRLATEVPPRERPESIQPALRQTPRV